MITPVSSAVARGAIPWHADDAAATGAALYREMLRPLLPGMLDASARGQSSHAFLREHVFDRNGGLGGNDPALRLVAPACAEPIRKAAMADAPATLRPVVGHMFDTFVGLVRAQHYRSIDQRPTQLPAWPWDDLAAACVVPRRNVWRELWEGFPPWSSKAQIASGERRIARQLRGVLRLAADERLGVAGRVDRFGRGYQRQSKHLQRALRTLQHARDALARAYRAEYGPAGETRAHASLQQAVARACAELEGTALRSLHEQVIVAGSWAPDPGDGGGLRARIDNTWRAICLGIQREPLIRTEYRLLAGLASQHGSGGEFTATQVDVLVERLIAADAKSGTGEVMSQQALEQAWRRMDPNARDRLLACLDRRVPTGSLDGRHGIRARVVGAWISALVAAGRRVTAALDHKPGPALS
jgi:hypothetical protein